MLSPCVQANQTALNPNQCDPYQHYDCLDTYLGESILQRLFNDYLLEMGHTSPPLNPSETIPHRKNWPETPLTSPPDPFTEWPYGATTAFGVSYPNAVDSPLMTSIQHTSTGKWLEKNHIQWYGWINGGGNLSSNTITPGGNAPMANVYTPNHLQLDQLVLNIERAPNTVQQEHLDFGFRISTLYGENYRFSTSYGIVSDQLLQKNASIGYDFPLVYGELYIPHVAEGLLFRLGRFTSAPDIENPLSPYNYMYSHSMISTFDNVTNEGLVGTLALSKQFILQLGMVEGTDTAFWNTGKRVNNPAPNPLYPDTTFLKDPGARPSAVACVRYTWNQGKNTLYPCMNGINNGVWGFDNLQWFGFTFYHIFNDDWHLSSEFYSIHQNQVANINNPIALAAIASGGTPFSPQYMPYNRPNGAQCNNPLDLTCRASAIGIVAFINYKFSQMDNLTVRPEFYHDQQGQRTGAKTRYLNVGLGWQHWFSPQIEIRPEFDYNYALDAVAFNGNPNAGILPNKHYTLLGAADLIVHF